MSLEQFLEDNTLLGHLALEQGSMDEALKYLVLGCNISEELIQIDPEAAELVLQLVDPSESTMNELASRVLKKISLDPEVLAAKVKFESSKRLIGVIDAALAVQTALIVEESTPFLGTVEVELAGYRGKLPITYSSLENVKRILGEEFSEENLTVEEMYQKAMDTYEKPIQT